MAKPDFSTFFRFGFAAGLGFIACSVGHSASGESDRRVFETTIHPLISEYCLKCHSTEKRKGDLDLERFSSVEAVRKSPKVWQRVVEQLTDREMPPSEKPQPSEAQRVQLLSWANTVLDKIARSQAGDPGPVVLRRLSNAEYTYTVRDLTEVASLDPAREFPADSASGEGFMNVGNSLVMSPALLGKYFDAGKDIANHAMLLPDGLRFSAKTSRRDWTDEILAQIRQMYRQYSDRSGGDKVNLQGIVFETNEGGRLPLEKYLEAALLWRDSKAGDGGKLHVFAKEKGLSPKYLEMISRAMASTEKSLLLDPFRARWKNAKATDAPVLAAEISRWQRVLWKFNSVGHIGKLGAPKSWMEAVDPLTARQEVRLKLPGSPEQKEITLYLVVGDAGDGNENDCVVWQQPRFESPGQPPLLLRDLRQLSANYEAQRQTIFGGASNALASAVEIVGSPKHSDLKEMGLKYGAEPEVLSAWLKYLGLAPDGPLTIKGYFTNTMQKSGNYEFIKGWGTPETPSLVANSSDQEVRIPGGMKPHSIAVHPSPTLQACVGWRSPISGQFHIQASVQHVHPECGNGITWAVELRRGNLRQRLAAGAVQGGPPAEIAPINNLRIESGDLVSILIGPRDGNHSCDLTAVNLNLKNVAEPTKQWDLARDVSGDVLKSNPHPDGFGNADVWHFYVEPDNGGVDALPAIPAGSLLAKWQSAQSASEKNQLSGLIQELLVAGAEKPTTNSADSKLYGQIASVHGPFFKVLLAKSAPTSAPKAGNLGLDPALFGKHPRQAPLDSTSLCVKAPTVLEVRVPSQLVAGCDFVTTAILDSTLGREGSVQVQVLTNKPVAGSSLQPGTLNVTQGTGVWTSNNQSATHSTPILVNEGSRSRTKILGAFKEFRDLFPAALCYTKIVPVDEVVTLTLFYREDEALSRLMLSDSESARLDRLWNELHYVSQDALTSVDALEQILQFATQDADPKVFEPLREPMRQRAVAYKQAVTESQPGHVDAVVAFAAKAYRRPLKSSEDTELRDLYAKLRTEAVAHDEAIRLVLARVLVAPGFLYRSESPGPGKNPTAVSPYELASRLSYFLWSTMPDEQLMKTAASGRLQDPKVLLSETHRMLGDARIRHLATEFGCAWIHIHGFDELNEKSDRFFPSFTQLRGPMYEESIQFFTDFFQGDRPVLNILDSDYAFLNEPLAKYYGIPGVTGPDWRRVSDVKKYFRGGILAQAATLAKQSGASRTSPILRGNWVCEVLLGEKLPRPPKDVPRLPEEEASEKLSVRQLTEKHSTDPRCATCHTRMDPYGFALEGFDAVGGHREEDLAHHPIDTHTKVLDGSEFEGLDGLRQYLLTKKRDAFVRQFCRKLLGYALARSVQLSDNPLLTEMCSQLKANNYRINVAVDAIVQSPQFRNIRGRDATFDELAEFTPK
jgi:hypothetical protein